MSRLEELPPDQRAALSLLLRQRKSYAQVAAMLGIDEQAVHDRAHAALAVLAPRQARELEPARRHEIGDYLLGQQASVAERLRTRTLLSSTPPANAWAQTIAGELTGIGGVELPEIPPAPAMPALQTSIAPAAPAAPTAQAISRPAPSTAKPAASYSLAEAAASAAPWEPSTGQRSSRLGGALLLAAILAAVIVVIVLVSSGGSSTKEPQTTASTPTTTTGPKEQAHFALKAPGNSRSVGSVQILAEGSKRAFYIQAEHIPATKGHFFYAIWLYNSHTSALPLSKSPAVGKSHKLAGAAALPENAGSYKEILLTRETSTHPTHPGHVVLRGPFKLTG